MEQASEREINFCETCKINTAQIEAKQSNIGGSIRKSQEEFKTEDVIKSTEDSVDVILVSSRHLFRAPYSLHEKTAFASIVLDKNKIEEFKPTDADPLKITTPKNFSPEPEPEEAKQLLLQAINWGKQNQPKEKPKKFTGTSIDVKNLTITEEMYPDCIKKIMKGTKQDGRKRALSILLSFFSSLEMPEEYIEEKVTEWNKKNYKPLKQGYIKAQISWYLKNPRMPPNYDKPVYKELGILGDTKGVKNPINYTIKRAMKKK